MVGSIGYSLGIGSGIDTKALIEELAAASRAPKEALIARREADNSAKVSALANASSAIDSFAAALSSLISGGTLFTQPSVSDATVLGAKAVAGTNISSLSAQVEVMQLAQAQTLASVNLTTASDPVGQGDITLNTAKGSFSITIDATNDSLTGLADAINKQNAGVTASVVTQAGAARLVLKGATGEANAFTLDVPAGTTSGLERFAYGPSVTGGLSAAQVAQDAIVRIDGVEVRRGTNSFSDLIPGVQFDLKKAAPGSIISLGVTRPREAIIQAVGDFVAAYNELEKILDEATAPALNGAGSGGPLRNDLSIREMRRQLTRLTSTVLNSGGGPSTLAEIGIATNRDGTLRVDNARLSAALDSDPDGVEALFNPRQFSSSPFVSIVNKGGSVKPGTYVLTDLVPTDGVSGATGKIDGTVMISSGASLLAPAGSPAVGLIVTLQPGATSATITIDAGLGGALQAIRDSLRARSGPIATSQEKLAAEAKAIAEQRLVMETRAEAYHDQLVATYASMERRVSAFRATQSYLEQQIKAWNSSND